jgi:hypothetical protein
MDKINLLSTQQQIRYFLYIKYTSHKSDHITESVKFQKSHKLYPKLLEKCGALNMYSAYIRTAE